MYDVYRHVGKDEFRLTIRQGNKLPKLASASKWTLCANRKLVPRIVSEEVERIGYCVTRQKKRAASA